MKSVFCFLHPSTCFYEGKYPKYVEFREDEIRDICSDVREIFMKQPMLLELEAPLKFVRVFDELLVQA